MIIVVVDLGPGDGGKGGVVHKLATHHNASIIIKVGGAQGSHGVVTNKTRFAFSQWGCGTLDGIKTHLSNRMIISPDGLLNEADALRYIGITNAFDLITCDANAICATPYHGIISKMKELFRGDNPRGTIGSGVGEAYRDHLTRKDLTIYAKDLNKDINKKLDNIRDYCISKLSNLPIDTLKLKDKKIAEKQLSLIKDPEFHQYNIARFKEVGLKLSIVENDYLKEIIYNNGDTAIVESSHGILTDNQYGFKPHVSAIRTLPSFIHQMLKEIGYNDHIETIGVHRAYSIRHGAGPMPTADPAMNETLLPGSNKNENRWQGKVRVGPLDIILLRYALQVCGPTIDSLAITWFDQIVKQKEWKICDEYITTNTELFCAPNCIKIFDENESKHDEYQNKICQSLNNVRPIIKSLSIPNSTEEQYKTCNEVLYEKLGIPVSLISFGPTIRDKHIKG